MKELNYLKFKKEMVNSDIRFHRSQITIYSIMFISSLYLIAFGFCILYFYGLTVTLNILLGALIPNCIWSFTLLRMSLTDYKISKEYRLNLENMEDKT